AHMSLREDGSDERYKANTVGTSDLIEASKATPEMRRSIFTSTKYIFRDGQPEHDRHYNPDSTYGRSKAAMEELIWESDGGCPEWCIARPTTIWGPGMSKHYQRFLRMVRDGKYFHIGSGKVKKHMGFVGNAAAQYESLMSAGASQVHQRVFYITDYEPEIVSEWAEAFSRSLGGRKIHTLPKPIASLGGRVGDIIKKFVRPKFPFTSFRIKNLTTDDVCDPHLTEEVCGELPFTMEQGVEITCDWFRALEEERQSS
ncbi:MAG: NAD-dependent epimerase/dehydratase family protein, partial [Verrucomicrobiales bacterium]